MSGRALPAGRQAPPLRWLTLYLLGLLAVALFAGDWALPLSESWRTFLLLPLAVLVCALALGWVRRHEELVAAEGIDAKPWHDAILDGMRAGARPAEPAAPGDYEEPESPAHP